ncbi:Hypothetical protein GbCGDNIH9_8431 [Granulibacter bethesdensis]|uniref:Uncharacterized protein n=1 Tax=Granulibacter bethesdensis TaxID=364410 RepID=A0AAC9K960_9PROT|nr:Hypothetical protein GbCGDNIH9_8431 [Granulibacter bethesdensis]APH61455.1 Hypothetical protein GbCGDNIH8_8431 [Granulibacter bethesdensis]
MDQHVNAPDQDPRESSVFGTKNHHLDCNHCDPVGFSIMDSSRLIIRRFRP